jgi:uncharacterized phage protein (TIGR02220 family)
MAEGKKSFIAYSDWYGTFKALPDDIAGQLIKYIFSYVNDENPQPHENYIVNALFEQVKATLKRDLNKWERQREQRSEAGKRSAETRATKSNERSTTVNESVRNSTVSVNVNDSVNDINDSDVVSKETIDFDLILKTINETFGKKHKVINQAVRAKYKARLKDGYTIEDMISAIKNCKANAYHKENNYQYCTPEFFSRGEKIDMYSQRTPVDDFDMVNPPEDKTKINEWLEERRKRLIKDA